MSRDRANHRVSVAPARIRRSDPSGHASTEWARRGDSTELVLQNPCAPVRFIERIPDDIVAPDILPWQPPNNLRYQVAIRKSDCHPASAFVEVSLQLEFGVRGVETDCRVALQPSESTASPEFARKFQIRARPANRCADKWHIRCIARLQLRRPACRSAAFRYPKSAAGPSGCRPAAVRFQAAHGIEYGGPERAPDAVGTSATGSETRIVGQRDSPASAQHCRNQQCFVFGADCKLLRWRASHRHPWLPMAYPISGRSPEHEDFGTSTVPEAIVGTPVADVVR